MAGVLQAQTSTVVEFYNTNLKHYFIAAEASEVTAIESGAAGAGWVRTGETFTVWKTAASAPSGAQPVCRFYGMGPNSHFFTAVAAECTALRQQNPGNVLNTTSWFLENTAFFYVPIASGGSCASGQTPVTRFYNNRGLNVGINDANHRFVVSSSVASAMAAQGWVNEGVVFCAQGSGGSTPTTPGGNEDCIPTMAVGDTMTTRVNVRELTFNIDIPTVNVSLKMLPGEVFRGKQANYVVGGYDDKGVLVSKTYYLDTATTRTLLGSSSSNGITYYQPEQVVPKSFATGQSFSHDYTEYCTCDSSHALRYTGSTTYVGRESVTVPAGTFANACKFSHQGTIKGTSQNMPWDSKDTQTSWSGGGFNSLKNVLRGSGVSLGLEMNLESTLELVSGRTGGRSYP
ncbi:MAG: hypothetical protein RLZZ502_1821 [Pseudomonadota bacterium]